MLFIKIPSVFASNTYFVWEKTIIDVPLNAPISLYEDKFELSFYVNGVKSDDYIVEKEVNCSTFSTVLTHIIGRYTVYYKAYSKNNNISSTQAIIFNVIDINPPNVSLNKPVVLEYGEELAIKVVQLCTNYKIDSNTAFQIKKSSSSVFANITEAQYPQSLADMHSKLEIARKECAETESWLKLIFASGAIDEETFKLHRNLCGRIKRMLTASCITIENKLKQG